MSKNRYVATIEVYVYGDNDYNARMNAHKMLDKIDNDFPNSQPSISEMGSQPFASMAYRKLDDHSRPSKLDNSKDESLPF